MPIWITIERHSGVPIYLQIAEQFRHAMEVGALQPGEQLPTVRQLAGDLAIAPNTIVQAYDKLQGLGLIESRPGAGTVVLDPFNGDHRETAHPRRAWRALAAVAERWDQAGSEEVDTERS